MRRSTAPRREQARAQPARRKSLAWRAAERTRKWCLLHSAAPAVWFQRWHFCSCSFLTEVGAHDRVSPAASAAAPPPQPRDPARENSRHNPNRSRERLAAEWAQRRLRRRSCRRRRHPARRLAAAGGSPRLVLCRCCALLLEQLNAASAETQVSCRVSQRQHMYIKSSLP